MPVVKNCVSEPQTLADRSDATAVRSMPFPRSVNCVAVLANRATRSALRINCDTCSLKESCRLTTHACNAVQRHQAVLPCLVECERPHTKGRGFWGTVLLGLFAPVWILGALNREYKNPEVFGHELIVNTPLPLCSGCTAEVQRRKHNLSDLLCCLPLYERLLQAYPDANVAVSPQATAKSHPE